MFTLIFPWMLVLIPLPWLLGRVLPFRLNRRPGAALKVPFFSELTTLRQQASRGRRRWLQHGFAYLGWALLVFAAANPKWVGAPIEIPQSGRDLMLAVDISGSMQLPDMVQNGQAVDRLTAVKTVAKKFIDDRVGDRLGLILFGSKAYLQTPLTFDRASVQAMLNDASIGLAGPQTALGDAIGLALKHHEKNDNAHGVLILLTDGANNSGNVSPLEAATLAKEQGMRIYTIGVGADEMLIQGLRGTQKVNPSTDLDEDALKNIAELTGGHYFRAKDAAGLQSIYQRLNELEPINREHVLLRPEIALYFWPLCGALLVSVLMALRALWPRITANLVQSLSLQLSKVED